MSTINLANSAMKPIQATPELSGDDATTILLQVKSDPTEKAINKNKLLHSVLTNVRKAQ